MAQTQAQKDAARRAAQQQRDPETVETAQDREEAVRQEEPTTEVNQGVLPGGSTAEPETQEKAVAEQEERNASRATPDEGLEHDPTQGAPRLTTLDSDVSMPGYVAPGDGPHDTVVALEHATSVSADKANAGQLGFGVVNAVVPIPDPSGLTQALAREAEEAGESEARVEQYLTPGPAGKMVRVEHNLDTGATRVLGDA